MIKMSRNQLMKVHLVKIKMTQRKLAELAGIHYARVNNYLNGLLVIGADQEKMLCDALNLDHKAFKKNLMYSKKGIKL